MERSWLMLLSTPLRPSDVDKIQYNAHKIIKVADDWLNYYAGMPLRYISRGQIKGLDPEGGYSLDDSYDDSDSLDDSYDDSD
jgi:hypothetical protein